MKALAWDDHRKDDNTDYMSRLKLELLRYGIEMTVEVETSAFENRVRNERFDFYVTDWLNTGGREDVPMEEEQPGGDLLVNVVRHHTRTAPIFVISRHMGRIDQVLLNLGRPIYLKSKDVHVRWMAFDICENLRELGILIDSKKVFIIYGHDHKAEGTTREVEEWLRSKKIDPIRLESRKSNEGILPDLMREMSTSAAFIAVCTPDDRCEEGLNRDRNWWQPRENVLFEMGIVFGLHRGAERLTVLQKWVNRVGDECAQLPSDWGGYLTLRFPDRIDAKFEDLEKRLRALGVNFG